MPGVFEGMVVGVRRVGVELGVEVLVAGLGDGASVGVTLSDAWQAELKNRTMVMIKLFIARATNFRFGECEQIISPLG